MNLLRGDIKDAWYSNRVVLCMIPLFIYLFFAKTFRYVKNNTTKDPKYETVIEIIMVVVLVLFGIIRNILQII